jgi:hypothetical protein
MRTVITAATVILLQQKYWYVLIPIHQLASHQMAFFLFPSGPSSAFIFCVKDIMKERKQLSPPVFSTGNIDKSRRIFKNFQT